MKQNPFLGALIDIRMSWLSESKHPDAIVLLFDSIDTAREAMQFIKTWKSTTLALVRKTASPHVDVHLYDDTGNDMYSLIASADMPWDRDDIDDFITHVSVNRALTLMGGTAEGEEVSVPDDLTLRVRMPGYIYMNEKYFNRQRISDRN